MEVLIEIFRWLFAIEIFVVIAVASGCAVKEIDE